MAGRHIGIARVDYQRYAGSFKGGAGQFGAALGGGGGQRLPFNVGKIHAGLLEHRAVFQHAALALAQRAVPRIGHETRAVFFGFQFGADVVLHVFQYCQYLFDLHVCSLGGFRLPERLFAFGAV